MKNTQNLINGYHNFFMNENAIISRPHHGSKLFWDGKLR